MLAAFGSPEALSPSRRMRMRFLHEVEEICRGMDPGAPEIIKPSMLAGMPPAAHRYLRFMGVPGSERARSFRAHWSGRFRMGHDKPWMPCEVWQENVAAPVTRIFHMRVRYGGVVPLYVRDTYIEGHGRMRASVLNALDVVDEHDYRVTTGELVTYLNDALLFAPSMLLAPSVQWSGVDERRFDVSLEDRGTKVTASVLTDGRGALVDFSTSDRFGTDPAHPQQMSRARWTTPVQGWSSSGGCVLPRHAEAVWHFPGCEFAYAAFDFANGQLERNVL